LNAISNRLRQAFKDRWAEAGSNKPDEVKNAGRKSSEPNADGEPEQVS